MKKSKYVMLLRGINVGGNNKASMVQLKKIVESLGYEKVSTYINSGNVIFESVKLNEDKFAEKMETALHKYFKFPIKILVRSFKEIDSLCKKIPKTMTNDKKQRTDVLFLWKNYCKKSTLKLIKINEEVDHLFYIDGAIVWNFDRENYTKSKMNKFIGTEVYKNMTARNINTVRKLKELMG